MVTVDNEERGPIVTAYRRAYDHDSDKTDCHAEKKPAADILSVVMIALIVVVLIACIALVANSTSHLKLSETDRNAVLNLLAGASALSGLFGLISFIRK